MYGCQVNKANPKITIVSLWEVVELRKLTVPYNYAGGEEEYKVGWRSCRPDISRSFIKRHIMLPHSLPFSL
jgi:hypothetical protein